MSEQETDLHYEFEESPDADGENPEEFILLPEVLEVSAAVYIFYLRNLNMRLNGDKEMAGRIQNAVDSKRFAEELDVIVRYFIAPEANHFWQEIQEKPDFGFPSHERSLNER